MRGVPLEKKFTISVQGGHKNKDILNLLNEESVSALLEISCKILSRIWQESGKIFERFLHIL